MSEDGKAHGLDEVTVQVHVDYVSMLLGELM